jgi:hypothetical protein
MTFQSIPDYSYAYATCIGMLESHGVTIVTGSDFAEYKQIMAQGRPDHAPGLPFDESLHDLNEASGLWIAGYDQDGDLMHTQALRLFNLGKRNLSGYLEANFCDFRPASIAIDRQRSRYRPGPGAHRISGQTVYHGDVWLGGAPGRYRGTGLSSILGRLAFSSAMRKWNPNHIFGFMAKSVAQKGFPERQGYIHCEPHAITYAVRDGGPGLDGFMVYMDREDIRFILDLPMAETLGLAA